MQSPVWIKPLRSSQGASRRLVSLDMVTSWKVTVFQSAPSCSFAQGCGWLTQLFRAATFQESFAASVCILGPVDCLQRRHDGLSVLPGHELQRMADQVHDAGLDNGLREAGRF